MGYLDIRDREDIDKNIEKTLSEYFSTKVIVSDKYIKNAFVLCPKLNSAISRNAVRSVRKSIHKDHSVHKNIFLWILSNAYISLAFNRFGFGGCKYIYFEKLPNNYKNLLILPGNMKIKIFDFKSGIITNIRKSGFSNTLYKRETEFRKQYANRKYVLPIKEINESVYQENIINGYSYSRISATRMRNLEHKVLECLKDIQKNNLKIVSWNDYYDTLYNSIVKKLEQIECDKHEKENIKRFCKMLGAVEFGHFPVSDSHGDLQNGNIFLSNDSQIYILDWETVSPRSLFYDILTFKYQFRYRKDYLEKIYRFLSDSSWDDISQEMCGEIYKKRNVLAIYFLEDIDWLLEETISTGEKKIGSNLLYYSNDKFYLSIKDVLFG